MNARKRSTTATHNLGLRGLRHALGPLGEPAGAVAGLLGGTGCWAWFYGKRAECRDDCARRL